ncbi:hypothetical protein NDU88_005972 [Pleurodeles waltl]|uniref:Uncharacterized protein n=1 Tax=Pleurodeles waltl TaxID=8319 RepID=A0AAV7MBK7_PLEWA|nr:hypothetical protein NDU88_005972 [Pleurodeles waltl]
MDSPPPVKHKMLASAWRERGKKSATKTSPWGTVGRVETAAPPSKVGKGHSKTGKSGKIYTADKTVTSPAAQDTAATSPTAQYTAATSPTAQDTAPGHRRQQNRCPGHRRQQNRCPEHCRQQHRCPGHCRQQHHCPGHRRQQHRRSVSANDSDAIEAATGRMKHSGHRAPSRTSGD